VQHQERQAEHPERVLGPQFARLDVDVEPLGEPAHGRRGQLGRLGVYIGKVVARLVQLAAAVQHQAAARPGPRQQRGGEAGLRQREADADVAAPLVPVGGVDAHVDGFTGVGTGTDPAAHRHGLAGAGRSVPAGDGVDPAAHPVLRLPLAHRHVGLAQRPGQQRPVQQVAGAHPQPPLRHDVEREPGGVLVELADQRVGPGRVEGGPGQLVQRGHDADVRHVGRVRAAQDLRQGPDVVRADVPGLAGQRHHERDVLGLHPLGEQAQLRVAEQHGRGRAVADDRRRGGHRTRLLPAPSQPQPDQRAHGRPEQDLLRPPWPPEPDPPRSAGPRHSRAAPPARRWPGSATTARGSRPAAAWPAPPPPPRRDRPRPPARRRPRPPAPGARSATPRPPRRSARRTRPAAIALSPQAEPTVSPDNR